MATLSDDGGSTRHVPGIMLPILALLLSACAVQVPNPSGYAQGCPAVSPLPGETQVTGPSPSTPGIRVFFATNRLVDCRGFTGLVKPPARLTFSPFRGPGWTAGWSAMTTPGKPDSWLAVPPGEATERLTDSDKFIDADQGIARWADAVVAAVPAGDHPRILVFIHGFNNGFDDVIARSAQLSDIADASPVVALDWISHASAGGYGQDAANASWSMDGVEQLLAALARQTGKSRRKVAITLVAHSMGSQLAIEVLRRLDTGQPALARSIDSVVLASPDFDRAQAMVPGGALERVRNPGHKDLKSGSPFLRRVLVYASRKDHAIATSNRVNGYARLGTTICKGDMDYDLSQSLWKFGCHLAAWRDGLAIVDTGFVKPTRGSAVARAVRHTDFLDDDDVRDDLAQFIRNGGAGHARQWCGLHPPADKSGTGAWVIVPAGVTLKQTCPIMP
jgi:pimeloyl-ACP methyl ester carboxylesterase